MKPLLFAALLTTIQPIFAQNLSAPIPMDSKLTHGTLSNGLSYYIYPNQTPRAKAELRLVVKAGSLNENDNQRGLAHFLEHMAFNGTAHFPKNTLIDQLQQLGVSFGADLNAYTSSNETVYILPIPLNQPKNLDIGLQVLEDWAFHMNLEPDEVKKERQIVEEEWRLSAQNPEFVLRNQNIDLLLKDSRYPTRKPIGDINTIRTASPQLLRDFYRDWYRPDAMSVIVVGDVDVAKTRQLIESHFSAAQNPSTKLEKPDTTVPDNEKPIIGIFANKNIPQSDVSITHKERQSSRIDKTIQDYLNTQKTALIISMVNERFSAMQDKPNPTFVKAYAGMGFLAGEARSKRSYFVQAQAISGQEDLALKSLHEENQRIIQHGFSQDELNRAIDNQLANVTSNNNNKDKVDSADKAEEYIRGVVEHEPLPSISWESDINHKFISKVTLSEINQLVRSLINPNNQIVLLNSNQETSKVSAQQVLEIIQSTPNTQAQQSASSKRPLLQTLPKAGKIISTQFDQQLGLTTWQLSNGVIVNFKNTTFNDDKISFASYSDGGTSLIPDNVWLKTQWAFDGLNEAGLNGLNKTQLNQLLAGHVVQVKQDINQDSQGLSGSFSAKDAQTAFELMYSQMTGLNKDPEAFKRYVQRGISKTQNLENDRMSTFLDYTMRQVNVGNPRFSGSYPDALAWQNMDYNAAYAIRQQRFANANGMNFTFVGKINERTFKPLVQTYLASLPSDLSKTGQYKDNGYRAQFGGKRIVLQKGKENLSVVYLAINDQAPYKKEDALALQALGEILTIKLTEQLREHDGGVYSVNASGEMHARPYGEYTFTINFPCAPDKVDALMSSAQNELKRLITDGPNEVDLDKFKKAALVQLRENQNTNDYWVGSLQAAYKRQLNPQEILKADERINRLSIDDLKSVGQRFLAKPFGVAILKPE